MTKQPDNVQLFSGLSVRMSYTHWHAFPLPEKSATIVVRCAENSLIGSSSNENKTCIISFVLILPLTSLSTTTSFWASGQSDRDYHPCASLELID